MIKGSLVVDRGLRGIRVERLLEVRHKLRNDGSLGAEPEAGEDRPVLKGDGELKAGTLYPSSQDDTRRYYLPGYRVAQTDGGQPAVKLAYAPDDATGIHGTLRIMLTWDVPEWTKGELRQIDHQVALTLRHHALLEDEHGQRSVSQHAQIVELQPPSTTGTAAESLTAFMTKEQFDSVYQAMSNADRKAELHLAITARVGVKTWQQVLVNKPKRRDQLNALDRKNALFTSMLADSMLRRVERPTLTATRTLRMPTGRITVDAESRAEEARVAEARSLLLDGSAVSRVPSLSGLRLGGATPTLSRGRVGAPSPMMLRGLAARRNPRLAANLTATRLQPTPTPATPAPTPTPAAMPTPAPSPAATLDPRIVLDRDAIRRRPITPTPTPATPTPSPTPRATPRPTSMLRHPTVLPSSATAGTRRLPTLSAATLSRVNAADLDLRKAIKVSDLLLGGRKVVPLNLALATDQSPAVVDTELEDTQTIAFFFDPRTSGFVYAGYEPSEPHLLLKRFVEGSSSSVPEVFYQDNLMRDVVYIPPTGFRLVRDEVAPYAPTMTFLASDFGAVEDDANDGAQILYKIAVVYRLEPWIEPRLIDLVKQQIQRTDKLPARVAPISPQSAELTLSLGLSGVSDARTDAKIDPLSGITDTLELDGDTFTKFWRKLLPVDRGGEGQIRGTVKWVLFDGSTDETDVVMSLQDEAADLLDVHDKGPVGGPQSPHEVLLRNRIESPITLDSMSFHMQFLDAGAYAQAVDTPSSVVLAPQQEHTVRYRIQTQDNSPPPAVALSPLIVARPQLNVPAVLGQLMVKTGFGSLGFRIKVKAAPGVFDSGRSGNNVKPLTALLVEFDDGTEVELSPDEPEVEVGLVGRLIDQLTGGDQVEHRYLFRVTNVHLDGEGIRGAWDMREGDGDLVVTSPGVQRDLDAELDF